MIQRTAGWQFFIRSGNIISDHRLRPCSPTPPDFNEPLPFVPPSHPSHDHIANCRIPDKESRSKDAFLSDTGTCLHVPRQMHSMFIRTAGRLFLPTFSKTSRYPNIWLYSCANHPPFLNTILPFDFSFSCSRNSKSTFNDTRSLAASRFPDIEHRRCVS